MQCILSQIIQFPIDSTDCVSPLENHNMAARWLHCLWRHKLSFIL